MFRRRLLSILDWKSSRQETPNETTNNSFVCDKTLIWSRLARSNFNQESNEPQNIYAGCLENAQFIFTRPKNNSVYIFQPYKRARVAAKYLITYYKTPLTHYRRYYNTLCSRCLPPTIKTLLRAGFFFLFFFFLNKICHTLYQRKYGIHPEVEDVIDGDNPEKNSCTIFRCIISRLSV